MALPFLPVAEAMAFVRPAIVAPAPREVSFGTVAGRVDARTVRIVVKVDGVTKADLAPPAPSPEATSLPFRARVALPPRDVTVRVVAFDGVGNRSSRSVGPVYGLPRAGSPHPILGSADGVLTRRIRALVNDYPGVSGVFVQDLRTGRGAAWNARARFQAASTLKLGIAIEVLRVLHGKPKPGTRVATLFHEMLVHSDNKAANDLEIWLGGSTTMGSALVTATLRRIGLGDTYFSGGYIIGTSARRPIPLRVESQPPYFTVGKYTTPWDLARLHRFVHRAATGGGPLVGLPGSFTAADARYLLYTLAHVRDPGKIDRYIGSWPGVSVLHKAGWIIHARHDSALVFWRGGAFVVVVMTWHGIEAGPSADILAGRIGRVALLRFSMPRPRPDPHAWLIES
jgi:Beta-lactamase enzyme family